MIALKICYTLDAPQPQRRTVYMGEGIQLQAQLLGRDYSPITLNGAARFVIDDGTRRGLSWTYPATINGDTISVDFQPEWAGDLDVLDCWFVFEPIVGGIICRMPLSLDIAYSPERVQTRLPPPEAKWVTPEQFAREVAELQQTDAALNARLDTVSTATTEAKTSAEQALEQSQTATTLAQTASEQSATALTRTVSDLTGGSIDYNPDEPFAGGKRLQISNAAAPGLYIPGEIETLTIEGEACTLYLDANGDLVTRGTWKRQRIWHVQNYKDSVATIFFTNVAYTDFVDAFWFGSDNTSGGSNVMSLIIPPSSSEFRLRMVVDYRTANGQSFSPRLYYANVEPTSSGIINPQTPLDITYTDRPGDRPTQHIIEWTVPAPPSGLVFPVLVIKVPYTATGLIGVVDGMFTKA